MKPLLSRSEFNHIIDHPGSAAVLGLNDEKKVLLIEIEKTDIPYSVYEIPGGVLEGEETPEQAARRELREETGYTFDVAVFDHLITPSVGYSNEWISTFRARVSQASAEAEFQPFFFSKAEVRALIEDRRIIDAQSLAVLSAWVAETADFQLENPDVVFLCTGNYYRSRFCELYFNYLNRHSGSRAASYGLWAYRKINPGFISPHTVRYLNALNIPINHIRFPEQVEQRHFQMAKRVIALDEVEHKPMMEDLFPGWADSIEYWNVHDIDFTEPIVALSVLKEQTEALSRSLLH